MKPTKPMSHPELTVLIPCLNEEGGIAECVLKARKFIQNNAINGEVLVVDNNSDDRSPELAKEMGARVIYIVDRGYGRALIGGIEAAQGQFIIMGDGDGTYDFNALEPFLEKLRNGYDFVIGNRFREKMHSGTTMSLLHRIGNPLLSGIGKLFFRSHVNDFHCGLRGFRTASVRALALQCPGMEFASEMIIKAV